MEELQMIRGKLPERIQWTGPEHHHHEKDESWGNWVIILSTLLVAIALWQRNFLFAVFIAIATALIMYWGHKQPDMIELALDSQGFIARGKRYNFKDMTGFAIMVNENPDNQWNKLILRVNSRLIPHLVVFIPKNETARIHSFMTEYLREVPHEDHFIDVLADFLKF